MAVSEGVRRLLWAESGGYCMRPDCGAWLFTFYANGEVTSFDEIAHNIAESERGPRGDSSLPVAERDEYENLLLLCPTCHTIVDKKENHFPADVLRKWKRDRAQAIEALLNVPRYGDRSELNAAVRELLRRNRSLFDHYGPHSLGSDDPLSDAASAWARVVKSDVTANNNRILQLVLANQHLLESSELDVVERFRVHKEAFEYGHIFGERNASAPLFPAEMNTVFEGR